MKENRIFQSDRMFEFAAIEEKSKRISQPYARKDYFSNPGKLVFNMKRMPRFGSVKVSFVWVTRASQR